MDEIANRLARVQERIAEGAKKSGRSTDDTCWLASRRRTQPRKCRPRGRWPTALWREPVRKRESKSRCCLRACAGISSGTSRKTRSAMPSSLRVFHGIDSLALTQDMERIAAEEGLNRAFSGSEFGRRSEQTRLCVRALRRIWNRSCR